MKYLLRIFVAVFFVLAAAGLKPAGAQSFFDFLKNSNIGKPAPDFTLTTVKGETVNMTKFRDGKKAIIFFWATWCPHCRVALKELNQSRDTIEQKGIKLIVVDLAEEAPEVENYVKKNKITMDVFLDKENSLSESYGLIGVPTFYFVDEKGLVRAVEHALPQDYEKVFAKK